MRKIFAAILFLFILTVAQPVLGAWDPNAMPTYQEDVLDWWQAHPFNPDGTNYDMTINHPATTVTLDPGDSIQAEIDAAGPDGVTIYLNPGTYNQTFEIVDKSNIHIVAPSGATVASNTTHRIIGCEAARDYSTFAYCVLYRNSIGGTDCLECFRNPIKNIVIENITFDGNNVSAYAMAISIVRGLLFKGCTFQNMHDYGSIHTGLVNGNMKIENTWFIDCDFVGQQVFGFYIDGSHAGGAIDCRFYNGNYNGLLYLTNDDFSDDQNNDGIWQPSEKRNGQYNVAYNNWFENGLNYALDINQSGNMLIKNNVVDGYCSRFIYSTDRCSQRWRDLYYEGFDNRVIGNTVGSCSVFYDVNSRQNNCLQSEDCWNYGWLGKYHVSGNTVVGAATNFVYPHGYTVYDPNYVSGNCINDTSCTPQAVPSTNAAPTVSITSHSEGGTIPVAHDITITATASDSDGTISEVEFRVDNKIIGFDDTAPYEATLDYGEVMHGDYVFSAIARDNYGHKTIEEISVTAVDTTESITYTSPDTPLDVTGSVGITRTAYVDIDLSTASAAVLVLNVTDIDDAAEATMYINGSVHPLPCWVMGDQGPFIDCRALDMSYLVDGQNEFVFEFTDNLDNTTGGYEINEIKVIIQTGYSGNRVATPTITPAGGAFQCYADITMGCTTDGAEIWYSINGTEPNENDPCSILYTGSSVRIDEDTTVKAKAFKDGMDPSFRRLETYTVAEFRNADTEPDGDVDIDDFAKIASEWLNNVYGLEGDLTCDDVVDLHDFLILSNYWAPPITGTYVQDSGSQGLVCSEAENYNAKTAQGGHDWVFTTSQTGFSGSGCVQALPDDGANVNTGYSTNCPQLDFEVNFVKTGTHYVWVRAYATSGENDSLHVGLDGAETPTSDRMDVWEGTWDWSKDTMDPGDATIDITTTGTHTINLWMREAGLVVDKIILTTDPSYTPSGTGPDESPRL